MGRTGNNLQRNDIASGPKLPVIFAHCIKHVRASLKAKPGGRASALHLRAKPAVVNGEPRSDVKSRRLAVVKERAHRVRVDCETKGGSLALGSP
jgi:hypothetical protein